MFQRISGWSIWTVRTQNTDQPCSRVDGTNLHFMLQLLSLTKEWPGGRVRWHCGDYWSMFDKSLIDCEDPWKSPIKLVHWVIIWLSFDIVPIHILVQNTVSHICPHPRRWASSALAQSAHCIKIDVLCGPRQFRIPRHYSWLYCWRAANIYQCSSS
jgi:hypothetical protein